MNRLLKKLTAATALIGLGFLSGCHTDMWIQPKVKPLQDSDFFTDGQGSRPLVPHTIARADLKATETNPIGGVFSAEATRTITADMILRGGPRLDDGYYTGIEGKKLVDAFPFPIGKPELKRGQERFNIYCSPCHGRLGDGQGMIAVRGFNIRRKPADYHTERLKKMPVGHFYDVITNGFGVMYPYASRIDPEDRWKIAAYIRVLQRSEAATQKDVPAGIDLDKPAKTGEESKEGGMEGK